LSYPTGANYPGACEAAHVCLFHAQLTASEVILADAYDVYPATTILTNYFNMAYRID
jgi:hypothetical protein